MEGQALLLFAVSPNSVSLFNFQSQPPRLQSLDQIGSTVNSVTMSDRSELIIGRLKLFISMRSMDVVPVGLLKEKKDS
ncbi:unnamed protein product [Rhodiola kirilowii]